MKIFRNLVLLLLSISLLNGCIIKHEISFNEDFSGTYHFTLDMSQLNSLMTDSMQTSENQMNSNFDSLVDVLKVIPGISNINVNDNSQKGVLEIFFDFKDIDALNSSIRNSSNTDQELTNKSKPVQFKQKGNSISVIQEKTELPKDSASMAMNEMFEYEFSVSFKKNIKKAKVNNNGSQADNKITQKGKYFDILGKKTKWNIKFE